MMNCEMITVGPVATCCYILSREDAGDCIVVDPGDEPNRILRAAGEKRIAAILLTHGHFDHIGAVSALAKDGVPVLIHSLDADMLTDPAKNASLSLLRIPVSACAATDLLRDGDRRTLAGLEIEVIHTPGHTPGSVCYRVEDLRNLSRLQIIYSIPGVLCVHIGRNIISFHLDMGRNMDYIPSGCIETLFPESFRCGVDISGIMESP